MTYSWIEDLLPEGFLKKRLFGGFAYYLEEKLVLVLFESDGTKSYRGVDYPFQIWNGSMFPVEKVHQETIRSRFPFLIPHPVLPKWLYIPAESESFESDVEMLMREIRRRNPLLGSFPESKKNGMKRLKRSKQKLEREEEIIDTSQPRMFREEPAESILNKAKKISDLKNLGPESEKAFIKAGIRTPQAFAKLGWKKTMTLLCQSDPKANHSIFAYAVIGALEGKMWFLLSEEQKSEARQFMKSLREQSPNSKKKKAKKKANPKIKAKVKLKTKKK